jgi:DNA polymerase elongation subunit (family B)
MLETQQVYENEKNPTERIKLSKEVARLDNMQMARKIQLNSAYGALGNQYFRFFDVRQAEAITTGGQLATRWVERDVNKYLNSILKTEDKDYVIASDTDSIYVCLDDLVKSVFDDTSDIPKVIDFLDKVCDGKVQDCIDRSFKRLSDYMNAYQQKMIMKREVLADRAIWTGKKHYMINVHDSEGVRFNKPKIKVKGLESVKSSTPAIVRQRLVDAYKILMNDTEDDMITFVEGFRNEFESLPPEDVAFPRSVKGIEKYSDPSMLYKKGTPIHVKGTIIHNKLLKDHKLTRKYQIIQEGEKIKFSYLKIPNPVGDTVISMGNTLPKEFDLHRFIDYNMQFEKTFLGPLKDILNCVGWDHEKRNTIEDFFI